LFYKEMNNWTIKHFNKKYESLKFAIEEMTDHELQNLLQKFETRTGLISDKTTPLEKI